ncbi:MAG: elongation factor 4 [Chloroflexi bacterium]|nr:elongation factor 4 [Chloroflexota bacterium]MCI0769188.1 elongation factor 4 [Chloroflexota bacterium]
MDQSHIRNFCIIAHIDHGKSTLADRLLEVTHTIGEREMSDQFLDQMDLERERGITIKAHPIRMAYQALDGAEYQLNLLDTPGHVEFSYEVSRSVAACEGAVLVVDASQGIQAQTLANVYLALEHDLAMIPVINKIDLPSAEPERVAQEMIDAFGFKESEILFISAKEGEGIDELLEQIVRSVPPPAGSPDAPLRALIFDSKYDSYKGVIASVRVVDGRIELGQRLRLLATDRALDPLEIGVFKPDFVPVDSLSAGEVGYIASGLKSVEDSRVGDTVTSDETPASEALPGYKDLKPMVFAGLFPSEGQSYLALRDALDKLKLNDAGLVYEMENSAALGFGFRCGFLGMLHMEIVQVRLEREYDLELLATAPSVAYQVLTISGKVIDVDNPTKLPPPQQISEIREPWLDVSIIVPSRFIGAVMDLVANRRGEFQRMEYLDSRAAGSSEEGQEPSRDPRVLLAYHVPLAEVLIDFYDHLKSRTQGYASMDYQVLEFRRGDLVKVDILVNEKPVDALSLIIDRKNAYRQGRALVERLKQLIPRQLFEVPIQAAIGNKVIARETIRALRKNVIAKCYGGDVTRKMKLLKRQAEGKKRLKKVGNVEIPQEAFMALLKLRDS